MTTGYAEIAMGDIFDISSSKRVVKSQWQASGVPFYRAREIVKLAENGAVENDLFITEELFEQHKSASGAPESGDLMVSAVGTLGACYVVQPRDRFYYKDASVLRFHPKEGIYPRYFQHAFRTRRLLDQVNAGSGSTVGTLTISRAKDLKIPLPPLAEQKRIAGILDAADKLRAKRRESIAQLDTLLQSTFLDMFGDPVTNPMGWERKRLGEIINFIGGSQPPKDTFTYLPNDENIRLVQIRDFKSDKYLTYIPQKLARRKFEEDDVMIARYGPPVFQILSGLSGSYNVALMKAEPKSLNVEKVFIFYLLSCESINKAVVAQSERTAGQTGVNLKFLNNYPAYLPPIEVQRNFCSIVGSIKEYRKLATEHLTDLHTLFSSLQQRAFNGKL